MSSTLAAAKPTSANVSSAASSNRSTVSARRRLGRASTSSCTVTMQDCIGCTPVSTLRASSCPKEDGGSTRKGSLGQPAQERTTSAKAAAAASSSASSTYSSTACITAGVPGPHTTIGAPPTTRPSTEASVK